MSAWFWQVTLPVVVSILALGACGLIPLRRMRRHMHSRIDQFAEDTHARIDRLDSVLDRIERR